MIAEFFCRTEPAAALRGSVRASASFPRAARSARGSPTAADRPRRAPRRRPAGGRPEHPQRDGADRAEVRRHVLALDAVSARRASDEHAVLVGEVDGETVDLRLDDVGDRLVRAEPLADVVGPLESASSVVTLSSEPICSRCRTFWKRSEGGAPTRCVGESGVTSSGCASSSATSSS